MAGDLNLLIVEDSAEDAELVLRELRRSGLSLQWRMVQTESDFLAALDPSPDVVISDFAMPRFDGLQAVRLLRERGLDIPFILVSGTLGEEAAVQAMRCGATDYLLKDRIARLPSAVERAIDQRRLRHEREHMEQAAHESEERFRQFAENVNEAFWMTDVTKQQMVYISPGYERIWGRSCASLYASPRDWLEAIHPEDRERILRAATRQASAAYDVQYRILRPDGSLRWIRDRAFPVRNAAGQVYRIAGIAEDITERRQLEEQLRQVQKMESIGQLAGGLAHDFNNLLVVVEGHASLILGHAGLPADIVESAEQILLAGQRAAGLTRQLLTFSRKQIMQARPLDLNDVIGGVSKMLRRLVREDVSLHLELRPGLPLVQADPGMVEQVLMNLATNARDAMPGGGKLTISTDLRVVDQLSADFETGGHAGDYVRISVSDTGCGIPPEVLPRVFEPFFTTKEVGRGTGLGLATVYGIVNQHHGLVKVYSEPGQGTVFHLYFPAIEGAVSRPESAATLEESPGGRETLLLVEDDGSVRTLVRRLLERKGYQVLEAASRREALEVWRAHASRIDLLITDMVMPDGKIGGQLARDLRAERPGLKVIYSSGYSSELVGRDFTLDAASRFLQKPYETAALLHALRELLDGE